MTLRGENDVRSGRRQGNAPVEVVHDPVERRQVDRLDNPMSSSGTCRLCWAKSRSLPPPKPVQPNVVRPWRLAHSTARRMFGLLPEPLMAMSRSPALARFFSCSTKTRSKPSSLPQARMYGRVVGQAEDAQAFLAVVVEILAAQRALAEVFAEMRGVRAAAAVADDEDEAAAAVAVKDGVGQRLNLGRINS